MHIRTPRIHRETYGRSLYSQLLKKAERWFKSRSICRWQTDADNDDIIKQFELKLTQFFFFMARKITVKFKVSHYKIGDSRKVVEDGGCWELSHSMHADRVLWALHYGISIFHFLHTHTYTYTHMQFKIANVSYARLQASSASLGGVVSMAIGVKSCSAGSSRTHSTTFK